MDLVCVYDKTLYRNELNGYTIFTVYSKDCTEYVNDYGNITCAGKIAVYVKGMPLKVSGEFVKTKDTYTLNLTDACEYINDADVAVNFLVGAELPGVGPKIAEKIIQVTGPNIFEFIKRPEAADALQNEIRGLSLENVKELIMRIREMVSEKEVHDFIFPFGGNFNHAAAIVEKYGYKALEKLKQSPYEVGIDAGMRFVACDAIARALGKLFYSEDRIECLLVCSLRALASDGHVYSSLDDVYNCIALVVKHSAFQDVIPPELIVRAAYKSKKVNIETFSGAPLLSLSLLRKTEIDIVANLKRVASSCTALDYNNNVISDVEKYLNITYSDKQRCSFDFLRSTGVKILTGGPGTGKTTVINGLIYAYKQMYPSNIITLCAPTGRAAQKMSEATNMPASTIHRLLNIKPYGDEIVYKDQSDPLESDFLIVDEMSMTDETLFSMLIGAVKNNTLVLLCGDIDQLPSVGPGNILRDLIASEAFDVNTLDVVFRQSDGSVIINNAVKINSGDANLECNDSFSIINVNTADDLVLAVKEATRKYYSASNPFATQVLTSVKKDVAGVYNLNNTLQEIVNPGNPNMGFGITHYRVNDKVMMVRNNYDLGYVNGDLGIIECVNPDSVTISLNDKQIQLPKKDAQDMMLAYAATVHKSQGSEYNTVIVVLPDKPCNMLKRNILYTAVTRAKTNVVIISQGDALAKAVSSADNVERRTLLAERLRRTSVPK